MRNVIRNKRLAGSEIVAYACIGSAITFVLALTLGAFDMSERPRELASNVLESIGASAP